MGMYNYLNGEQIKCFSVPIVYIGNDYTTDSEVDRVCFATMGGMLESYRIGDEVPYKSSIYNFGKDFIVYDYRGITYMGDYDTPLVHFIRDGKVASFCHVDKLPLDIPRMLVIDNNGNPLNIQSRDDFFSIAKEFKEKIDGEYYSGLREIRDMFDDYIDSLREENPKEELKAEYERRAEELRKRTFDVFREKWYLDDSKYVSNQIGWLVDMMLREPKGSEESNIILDRYKQESSTFAKEVDEYKKWATDLYTSDEIDKLLKI